MQVAGEMLCRINAAVPASGASESELQMCELTVYVALHVEFGDGIDVRKQTGQFTILLDELYDRLVETSKLFVGFISSGVIGGAHVKHVSPAIATGVGGYASAIGETEDIYQECCHCVRACATLARVG